MSEHDEQVRLIEWWSFACGDYGAPEYLLFAIPNGGVRSRRCGAMLKAEGVRAGVPDLFLAIPRGQYGGLFVEMKRSDGKGRLSPNQKLFIEHLTRAGYATAVANGFVEARDVITSYLNAA